MIPISIEAEIQCAWCQAHKLLAQATHDPQEIADLISDLRICIERVKGAGLAGERELWWLIKRLAGLNSAILERPYLAV